jgi:hypothetical protein
LEAPGKIAVNPFFLTKRALQRVVRDREQNSGLETALRRNVTSEIVDAVAQGAV